MSLARLEREDFDFLLSNARAGISLGLSHFIHLDQPIGIRNYLRIAKDIAATVPPGSMLDWGCGFGQMTYLMRRRGFDVTSFDIGDEGKTLPNIPLCRGINVVRTMHPTNLPFADASFDFVLSCGVLEHVDEHSEPGNEIKSLHEIGRVLKPDGRLFIYQLPQRYAWMEAITRQLRLGYSHPRRFVVPEIREMLRRTGYSVERVHRASMVPKNLTGIPRKLRNAYNTLSGPLMAVDNMLCAVPGLRSLAGVLEITARYDGRAD